MGKRVLPEVSLAPLRAEERETFVRGVQEAFRYGATEEFGMRDAHFEEEGEIIARKTIFDSLNQAGARAFRIVCGGRGVGGMILLVDEAARTGALDILFVEPAAHGRGIGQAAWAQVEARFPQIGVWTTHTPHFETRNIHFYVNCLGFRIVEYYHAGHSDPHHAGVGDADWSGMFRFEKRIGSP